MQRRFNDFYDLYQKITTPTQRGRRVLVVRGLPKMPATFLKSGDDPRVIAERTPMLQEMLDVLWLEAAGGRTHPAVIEFLNAGNDTRAR